MRSNELVVDDGDSTVQSGQPGTRIITVRGLRTGYAVIVIYEVRPWNLDESIEVDLKNN